MLRVSYLSAELQLTLVRLWITFWLSLDALFFVVDLFRKPGNPDVALSLTEIEDLYKWKHFLLLVLDSGKKSNFTIMKNEQNRTLFKKVLGYCSYIV